MFFLHTVSDTGTCIAEEKKEELKAEKGTMGWALTATETKHPPSGEEQALGSECSSSTAQETSTSRLFSTAVALDKALSTLERPKALSQKLEKPPLPHTCQKKSPSTAPATAQTLEKLLVSPLPQEKTPSTISAASESPRNPQVSPLYHKKNSPSTVPATVQLRNSTQEREELVSKQHTTMADQITEPPLSE